MFTQVRLPYSVLLMHDHMTSFISLCLSDMYLEGSHMECQYALFSFGIRKDQFPLTVDGALKREHFLEWQRDRQAIEERNLLFGGMEQPPIANDSQQGATRQFVVTPPPFSGTSFGREEMPVKNYPGPYNLPHHQVVDVRPISIISPMPNDVLFGRGKAIKEHPANVLLHRLVDERMLEYEMSLKWEKTVTASEIMAMFKERHGRFLKMEGGNWVEVDSEVAREKVSHVFRSRRRIIASSADSQYSQDVSNHELVRSKPAPRRTIIASSSTILDQYLEETQTHS